MAALNILRATTLIPTSDFQDNITKITEDEEDTSDLRDFSSLFKKCSKLASKYKINEALVEGRSAPLKLDLFSGTVLKDYQRNGVAWAVNLHEQGLNGILADEMGLGKTAQSIAIMCHMISSGAKGPFLVLAPLSTISNWKKEFNRFAPKVPVIKFHGKKDYCISLFADIRKRVPVENGISIQPVVIAPYHSFKAHVKRMQTFRWSYLVVDEASVIKSEKSEINRKAASLRTRSRLLLTGTPLQNNLPELYSLLHFLLPNIFKTYDPFQNWIEEINDRRSKGSLGNSQSLDLVSKMHQILCPFFLRRTKKSVDLQLPPKKHLIVYCPMTLEQKILYEAALGYIDDTRDDWRTATIEQDPSMAGRRFTRSSSVSFRSRNPKRLKIVSPPKNSDGDSGVSSMSDGSKDESPGLLKPSGEENHSSKGHLPESMERLEWEYDAIKLVSGSVRGNFNHTNILMLLRNIVSHPWILRREYQILDKSTVLRASGKLQVFDLLLTELLKRGHKVLVLSQFVCALDIISGYLDLSNIDYFYLKGSTDLDERQENIDAFNEETSKEKVFLISTRAGGMGINLTGADTVIFYDTDWNPQVDLQAADRCHRIGQTKPVVVYRLIGKESIDERILESATNKRRLEKLLIDCGEFKNAKFDKKHLLKILKTVDWDAALDHQYLDAGMIANLANRDFVFKEYDDKENYP